MVQEIRDIILSLDEVLLAFDGYHRITPGFLPKDSVIIGCKTLDGAVVLSAIVIDGSLREQKELMFKGVDVLRPLIRFCIENNVMLPRDGKKSILIDHDKIRIHIELILGLEMPAALSPMREEPKEGNITRIPVTGRA